MYVGNGFKDQKQSIATVQSPSPHIFCNCCRNEQESRSFPFQISSISNFNTYLLTRRKQHFAHCYTLILFRMLILRCKNMIAVAGANNIVIRDVISETMDLSSVLLLNLLASRHSSCTLCLAYPPFHEEAVERSVQSRNLARNRALLTRLSWEVNASAPLGGLGF